MSSTTTAPLGFSSTPALASPSPSVLGTRPVANITQSTSTGSQFAIVTLRPPRTFSRLLNSAWKRNSIPFIRLIWSKRSRICSSYPRRMTSVRLISVTCAPNW